MTHEELEQLIAPLAKDGSVLDDIKKVPGLYPVLYWLDRGGAKLVFHQPDHTISWVIATEAAKGDQLAIDACKALDLLSPDHCGWTLRKEGMKVVKVTTVKKVMPKMGCKQFVHDRQTLGLVSVSHQLLSDLGPAPKESFPWHDAVEDLTEGNWGYMGNDDYSDCVEADDAHQLMLWSINAGYPILPTIDDTLAVYSDQTGFKEADRSTDQGTAPVANANYLMKVGFLGHKISAWVPISTNHREKIKWGIHLFGGSKFCLALPHSAIGQYELGMPWDVVADDGGLAGGHDVLAVHYFDDAGVTKYLCVSGDHIQVMTEAFVERYLTMSIACLSKDMFNKDLMDAAGLDYNDLIVRLRSLN